MESAQRLILFSIFLAGLVHITFSAPYPNENEFSMFRDRLRKCLRNRHCILPMTFKDHFIEYLGLTSNVFKDYCLYQYPITLNGDGDIATVHSLKSAIDRLFSKYKARNAIVCGQLEDIRLNDPIGLNVYLTKNNVDETSPTFTNFVREFHKLMNERLYLSRMQTDNSLFDFPENEDGTIKMIPIPSEIRQRLATEFASIPDETFELFAEIAMEQLSNITMYTPNNVNFKEHKPINADDVQIIFNELPTEKIDDAGYTFNKYAKCIYYRGYDKKVFVYSSDSSRPNIESLTEKDFTIISQLYPSMVGFNTDKNPKTVQDHHATSGIFSICYALMRLCKEDPSEITIMLNKIHGDETVYVRIFLLKMLANRKIEIFK